MSVAGALIGGSLIGGAASAYSAHKQGEAAEDAAKAQEKSIDWQKEQADRQWERYLEKFAPIEDRLTEEVVKPVEEQSGFKSMVDSSMSHIDKNYNDSSAGLRRAMGGRYQYGSGVESAFQNTNELNKAEKKSDTYSNLYQAADQNRFSNMMQTANLGQGHSANAQQAYSNAANSYGNMASTHANAAANAWQGVGNTAGNLTQMYMFNKMMKGA